MTGCGFGSLATPSAEPGAAIRGVVHGGQQPIGGAHIYLMAANTTGYGGPGIAAGAANASVSLLQYSSTQLEDSLGAYVLSDASGNFNISGDYNCTPGQQVYLYATGGNPGSGVNAAVGMMAVLGSCPAAGNFATATPYVTMNEVSTVAAAFALAGFASDATHVSSSGTALAQTGILNAFATTTNLATLSTGVALATTPAGNGLAPQATVNTLANVLATCVNTADVYSGNTYVSPSPACSTLFATATADGTATGAQPVDTASAAINIAHFPGANVATLFGLPSPTAPFTPSLPTTTTPNDLTLTIGYNGGGIREPYSLAIDGSGNVWATNSAALALSELSPLGAALSPSTGFTGGGISVKGSLAIDGSGNVWALNSSTGSLNEFSSAGVPNANSPFTGVGGPTGHSLTIDGGGNLWVPTPLSNSLYEFNNAGVLNANAPYTGGGLNGPESVAFDGTGNVWVGNYLSADSGTLSEFSSTGTPITTTGYTGGGFFAISSPIAIDNSGDVWALTESSGNVPYTCKVNSTGTPLCPAGGYAVAGGASAVVIDGAGTVWTSTNGNELVGVSNSGTLLGPASGYYIGSATILRGAGVAVDGSGNVWMSSSASLSTAANRVWEFVGLGSPVVTPLAANLAAPYNAPSSKP